MTIKTKTATTLIAATSILAAMITTPLVIIARTTTIPPTTTTKKTQQRFFCFSMLPIYYNSATLTHAEYLEKNIGALKKEFLL
jgi:hypothetical protein